MNTLEFLKMDVAVKKLHRDTKLPTCGSANSAGMDLYSYIDDKEVWIPAHETRMIGTGIAAALPEGTFGAIFARSGLAKKGLRPANCVGVVDSDYRGEIKVALHNDSEHPLCIINGDRIAQLVLLPYLGINWTEVEDLDKTERGEGGFGSTGVN